MARIAGIDLPKQKKAYIGLTYIYGIGEKSSLSILSKANVNSDKKVSDLTEEEIAEAREFITTITRFEL